jgi:hypothetical protein
MPTRASSPAQNLLNNGDFRRGTQDAADRSRDSVDGWRTDAWIQDPGATDYLWLKGDNGPPSIEVLSHKDNDARWSQPVSLSVGWYYISVEARTEGAQTFTTGANISILEDGIASHDIRGTGDWTKLGFFLEVGARGADVEVCLRLGGFGRLTRGAAFFRDARVVRVTGPEPNADAVFDLDQIRKQEGGAPIGSPISLLVTFLVFATLAITGWILLSEPLARVSQPTAEAPRVEKRKARAR